MDTRPGATVNPTVLRFAPDRRYTVAASAAALACGGAAVVSTDPAGRLLLIGAALVLAGYALTDVVFAPRITATADGIVLNAPFGRARLGWDEVESIRADTRHRLGLRATSLEIDSGAALAVFSRRALGTDPEHAVVLLRSLDPRAPGNPEPSSREPAG